MRWLCCLLLTVLFSGTVLGAEAPCVLELVYQQNPPLEVSVTASEVEVAVPYPGVAFSAVVLRKAQGPITEAEFAALSKMLKVALDNGMSGPYVGENGAHYWKREWRDRALELTAEGNIQIDLSDLHHYMTHLRLSVAPSATLRDVFREVFRGTTSVVAELVPRR